MREALRPSSARAAVPVHRPRSAPGPARLPVVLLRAAHPGPGLAVTTVAGLLALLVGLPTTTAWVAVAAVFSGQLSIGWANDLVDAARDRLVGRPDKPIATGELSARLVGVALLLATVACVGLSLLLGWRSAVAHLVLGVASGHLYNLWLKATAWSWVPYAVAFGSLPAVVTLAASPPSLPAPWLVATAAALGTGAHLLNAVPDLADDEATGVRGLPHRLGPAWARRVAVMLLVGGSVAATLGPDGAPAPWMLLPATLVLLLAVTALRGEGRGPFAAAVGIALVDVLLLVVAGR